MNTKINSHRAVSRFFLANINIVCFIITLSCKPTPKSSVFNIETESKADSIKIWTTSHLFQNIIEAKADKIELEADVQADSTSLEIRAFKHNFFDGDTALKSTWVLGYVRAETPIGEETLPGPTIETSYGFKTKVHVTNKLQETIVDNPNYPKMTYKGDTCKWYPIIYNINDSSHIKAAATMLYPKPTQKGITLCGKGLNTKGNPEMASYYGTTVHLHGSNTAWRYDGYPNSNFTQGGVSQDVQNGVFGPNEKHGNALTYYYTNDFPEPNFTGSDSTKGRHGAILWYHDHAMMRTSANVYAGLLAPYIIEGEGEYDLFSRKEIYSTRAKNENFLDKALGWFGFGSEDDDIPLVINDKTFLKNGFLYYNTTADKDSSEGKDGIQPEYFGNAMVVNGKLWPKMDVKAKTYRFRLLNTCSSRTLSFGLAQKDETATNGKLKLKSFDDSTAFIQIGTESGLLVNFNKISKDNPLTLAPGERADILIDFRNIQNINELVLVNFAPDSPYGDANDLLDFGAINHQLEVDSLMNVVMQFSLSPSTDQSKHYNLYSELNTIKNDKAYKDIMAGFGSDSQKNKQIMGTNLVAPADTFDLTLEEFTSYKALHAAFIASKIGFKDNPQLFPFVLMNGNNWDSEKDGKVNDKGEWEDDIKKVDDGATNYEVWKIVNKTPDMHPIHIHLNRFEVLYRIDSSGKKILPYPEERGWKDVVKAPKGMTTYIKIKYILNHNSNPLSGEKPSEIAQFVYHCHILEHEDVSMMRRLVVKSKPNLVTKL